MKVSLREWDADIVLVEDIVDSENDLAADPQPSIKLLGPEEQPEIQGTFPHGIEEHQGLRLWFDVRMLINDLHKKLFDKMHVRTIGDP
jgi:hypothetical protein